MLQGTSSDVGKSILTAAFCRIFLQDGWSVAPFKAQNMSLNSFVTRDGLEMGRAQVLQAQAARLDPEVRMNPVLLKPSVSGCQIMLMGKLLADQRQYNCQTNGIWEQVKAAYDGLASEYDLMILEGAGSCGEINLKKDDLVNMRMADHADASVLLVGDIERGGVFASFVGHYELMEDWEKKRLAGYLINRFRGDASLLEPALEFMEKRTGRPVYGVVPYIHPLGLPEEDSVSFKNGLFRKSRPNERFTVEIALIDLPHISNFTDLEPFLAEPDVHLAIVKQPKDLGNPDAVILPGSKNVIHDLYWLRSSGVADRLLQLSESGRVEIIGICGGYQMLGERVSDPHGMESSRENIDGLGFLPLQTVLEKDKHLTQRVLTHLPSGLKVRGYEIHHGFSSSSCMPLLRGEKGEREGALDKNGLLWGTYLHGIFDDDRFRRWFIDQLRLRRGEKPLGTVQALYDLEPALDRLAEIVRASVNMEKVYSLLDI